MIFGGQVETCNAVYFIEDDMQSHPDVFSLSTTARGYTATLIKIFFTSHPGHL